MFIARWLPLLLALQLAVTLPALANHTEPSSLTTLIEAVRERMGALSDNFERWRQAPYERLESDFQGQQEQLRREIEALRGEIEALRTEVANIQLVPGPPGPAGPPGPVGPVAQGLPGNLQLAGETCAAGQAVSGFDAFGNVLCAEIVAASSGGVGLDCPHTLVSTADLRRCDLRGEQLSGRDLSFATLIKADLRNLQLRDTDLQGADLRNAQLGGAALDNVNLAYANLTFARLGSALIEGSDLSGAQLRKAELSLAHTRNARLGGADLTGASLILSEHRGSDFSGANLTGANLRQAVFENATLFLAITSTSLDQARLINTICPDGVNSSTNGDSCVGHTLP